MQIIEEEPPEVRRVVGAPGQTNRPGMLRDPERSAGAAHVDAMGHMTLDKTEFNFIPSAGVSWRWGAESRRQPDVVAIAPAAVPPGERPVVPPPVAPAPRESPAEPQRAVLQAFEVDMNVTEGEWRPEYLQELDAIAKLNLLSVAVIFWKA